MGQQILLIEDHEIIVWALTRIIEKGFKGTGLFAASSFNEGLRILERNTVNLIILDIDMPDGNTPSMITDLHKVQSQVPILVHSGLPEKDYSLKYLGAGANGFVSKNAPFSTISDAISVVLNGKKYISTITHDVIAETFLNGNPKAPKKKENFYLTERENEVIRLLLKGKWTKEIAAELGLKVTTISTHKGNIFEKFGVDNSVELFIKVQEEMPELLEAS
jgi:DNA-binding NarL/FixJ family response regulator